jgi:hypothetical protein
VRGASDEQLRAANTSLKLSDAYQRGEVIGQRIRTTFLAIGAAAATGLIAAAAAFDSLVKKAANFQDLAEKTGDTAQNIASLAVAAEGAGVSIDAVAAFSTRLTKNLTGVDDESKAAGAAIAALGLNLKDFKALAPADQLETIGKALNGFEEGAAKSAVAIALLGRGGADALPFLKELGSEGGRQVILTQEQIRLADEYSDSQAKLRTEISLQAQAIATEAIPAVTEFTTLLRDIAKDQEFAATASDVLKGALAAGVTIFQTIAIVAANVAFVFKGVGREVGAIAAQLVALASLDIKGFTAISDAVREDGIRARAELDKFEAKLLGLGQASAKFADPRILGNPGSIAEQTSANNKRPTLRFNGAAGGGGSGVDKAAREAEQVRRAELDADIKFLREKLGEERDTISFHQRELSAIYSAGNLSLREFYDRRNKEIADGAQRELNLLTDEQARLEVEIGRVKDPSDRIKLQTQLDESVAKSGKVAVAAAREATLAKLDEVAAFKQLQESVNDYRANLLQLQGDEAGAARLRAAAAIDRARILSKQSGGRISEADVQAQARALESQIAVNVAKDKTSQINQKLAIEEERIALLQSTGSIGEIEALQRTGAARQKVYGELAKQVEELQKQADQNPLNVQLQIDASKARLELDKLGEQLDPLKAKFDDLFRDSAGGAINDFLNGTKSAKEALRGFGKSILTEINSIASKELANQLFGKGGQLGSAGGLLAGLFGGKKGGSAADIAAAGGVNGGIMGGQSFSGEKSIADLFKTADAASQSVDKLAMAADSSGRALTGLPGIIQSLLGSVSSSGGGGSGGGWGSLIGSVLGAFSGGGSSFSSFDTSGYSATGDISGAQFSQTGEMIRARRALGGPVSAHGAYRVNDGREREPELLTISGKDYLMMGSKPGKVSTMSGESGAPMNNTFNVTVPATTPRETANQIATRAARKLDRAKRVR